MLRKLFALKYKYLLKPIFFRFNPEKVHDTIVAFGRILGAFAPARFIISSLFSYNDTSLAQTIAGVYFKNPLGLSAGFDKNAMLLKILDPVGFGFVEIGSVTLDSYGGNPKPWLWRLPKSKALVVYYGLKNDGVKAIAERIEHNQVKDLVLGISIAKTNCPRTADQSTGVKDYYDCLDYLNEHGLGAYYTLNISCPNAYGGEPFTTASSLEQLLTKIDTLNVNKPVFVKMPINLNLKDFDALLQVILRHNITGVIIGNLTKVRDPQLIKDTIPQNVKGGISGLPTQKLSNDLIAFTYNKYKDKLVIIGVGGIFSAEDAYEKIKRGASLVQMITGMVFEGPQLIGQINKGLVKLMHQDGYQNIKEAVGTYKDD